MNAVRASLLRWLGVEPTPWCVQWVQIPDDDGEPDMRFKPIARFNNDGNGAPLYVLASEKHLAEEKP